MTAPGPERPPRSPLAHWAAVSIAAGLGAAMVLRHPAPLADPTSCAGAFDFLAVIASRTFRDVPLGSMLSAGNTAALVVALALLAHTLLRITSAAGVALAITLAAATSPVFSLALAPSSAAGFAVVIATWAAALRAFGTRPDAGWNVAALLLLGFTSMAVTPLAIPAAVTAAWLTWRRAPRAILAASAVLGASLLMLVAMPAVVSGTVLSSVRSCVLPHTALTPLASMTGMAWALSAGPLPIVLAALGLLSLKRLPRGVTLSLVPLVAAALWGASVLPESAGWTMAPAVLAFWIVAAAGLAEVWATVRGTTGGTVGAAALSIVLVVMQVLAANERHTADRASMPDGHDRLTLAMAGVMVTSLPQDASLVVEDASTDLLARALPSRLRAPGRFHFVPRNPAAIATTLQQGRVFVLPRSQRQLQHLGFELTADRSTGVPGLAEVSQAFACSAPLTTHQARLPEAAGHQQFALVADDETSRGPIVVLLASDVPLAPSAVSWPKAAMRGFYARTFDLSLAAEREGLDSEIKTYELASWEDRPSTRYVTRVEMWRTPNAPFVLPVALGGTPSAATARLLATTPGQQLRLCPSYPFDVRSVAQYRDWIHP